jgi:4-hydroxybenzoate polyprenyltransferase
MTPPVVLAVLLIPRPLVSGRVPEPLTARRTLVLVVTALGGAEQIPFLTVWAVLPASVAFVLVFGLASTRLPRAALFNALRDNMGLFLTNKDTE